MCMLFIPLLGLSNNIPTFPRPNVYYFSKRNCLRKIITYFLNTLQSLFIPIKPHSCTVITIRRRFCFSIYFGLCVYTIIYFFNNLLNLFPISLHQLISSHSFYRDIKSYVSIGWVPILSIHYIKLEFDVLMCIILLFNHSV